MDIRYLQSVAASVLNDFPACDAFTIVSTDGNHTPESNDYKKIIASRPLVELNEIVQFLVAGGFLINRLDLSLHRPLVIWSMTEQGRELAELGDWDKYEKLQQLRKAKKYDPLLFRSLLAFWTRYLLTVIVGLVACYEIVNYSGRIRDLSPLDPPSPYFVCTWIFLIFIIFARAVWRLWQKDK